MSAVALDPAVAGVLRLGLGLLLAASVWPKLRHFHSFREAVAGYRILPPRATHSGAAALAAAEAGVAAGLLLPTTARGAALAAACLLAVYSIAIGVNLLRGRRDIDCGCAGPGRRRPLGESLLVRNAALVALSLLAALPGAPRDLGGVDVVTIGAGGLALALLVAAADAAAANAPRLRALRGTP